MNNWVELINKTKDGGVVKIQKENHCVHLQETARKYGFKASRKFLDPGYKVWIHKTNLSTVPERRGRKLGSYIKTNRWDVDINNLPVSS